MGEFQSSLLIGSSQLRSRRSGTHTVFALPSLQAKYRLDTIRAGLISGGMPLNHPVLISASELG